MQCREKPGPNSRVKDMPRKGQNVLTIMLDEEVRDLTIGTPVNKESTQN